MALGASGPGPGTIGREGPIPPTTGCGGIGTGGRDIGGWKGGKEKRVAVKVRHREVVCHFGQLCTPREFNEGRKERVSNCGYMNLQIRFT